jgi:hypothetical protein
VAAREGMTIRSFRVVFDLERRIHKVDRWRLPVPHGVPLRGIAYGALALAAILVLRQLPLAGAVLDVLPPPIRYLIAPAALAYALTRLRIDGRPAHVALWAWARFRASPRHLACLRPAPADGTVVRLDGATLVPDERSARLRRGVVKGPGEVLLRYPARGRMTKRRRPSLRVEQLPGPPLFEAKRVRLKPGQRLVVGG